MRTGRNQNKTYLLSPDSAKALNVPKFSIHNSVELRGYTDIPKLDPINKELSAKLVRGYYTSVSYTDKQVGKVLAELHRLKLDKNTVVVLLSDHGFHLGEHGMWGKTTNSKTDTRVPLMISDPSLRYQPKASDTVVQLIDLYATLSDLCGLPKPETDGNSFAAILKAKAYRGSGMAFSQFPDDMQFKGYPKTMGYAVHTNAFGYTEWIDLKADTIVARELYDYKTDPAENINVAETPKYKKIRQAFNRQVKLYRK
ncbi:sulfatase-like hydrolase/transferase [Mucilaginibacter corticis]|uniref:sulfatase-like hydrolase/transferase n=1 Tax=Mucilaginibacter corticis TaxID=2597670 RepID=UPI001643228A|nr:sulfatase-like hydrolase/transferase [Mucilaginibacter corticis]